MQLCRLLWTSARENCIAYSPFSMTSPELSMLNLTDTIGSFKKLDWPRIPTGGLIKTPGKSIWLTPFQFREIALEATCQLSFCAHCCELRSALCYRWCRITRKFKLIIPHSPSYTCFGPLHLCSFTGANWNANMRCYLSSQHTSIRTLPCMTQFESTIIVLVGHHQYSQRPELKSLRGWRINWWQGGQPRFSVR